MPRHPPPPQLPGLFAAPKPARKPRQKPVAPESAGAGQAFTHCAEIAVAAQLEALTYGIPLPLAALVVAGICVAVPVRGRIQTGVVLQVLPITSCAFDVAKLRPILAVPDSALVLPPDLLATVLFVARYYHAPVGQAARLAMPAAARRTGLGDDTRAERNVAWVGATYLRPWPAALPRKVVRLLHRIEAEGALPVADLRRKTPQEATETEPGRQSVSAELLTDLASQGLIRQWHERLLRDPLGLRDPVPQDMPPTLHRDQALAVTALTDAVATQQFSAHLLHGVTGSGKTEVYLHTIAVALATGRGAIVLVPEIALTPQLVQRFRARFGDQVAALHSAMSEGERLDQLDQVQSGARRIVIGPRSALFAPVANLGVIVVDECHDASYKQQSGLRYHARDVALIRGQQAKAVCVLGSATPGCEEWQLHQAGKLQLHSLPERALHASLPDAQLVDLRHADRLREFEADRPSLISVQLADAIAETVQRGEQVMLLHNRRGFATTMLCRRCGAPAECPECAVALTWHKGHGRLRCHWCDLSQPIGISCPFCGAADLIGIGAGTERIEATLSQHLLPLLPGVRIARFDRDTASGQRLLDTLGKFRDRQLDVLVGTQMLAKGHDFPAVTLVGVLLAEEGLRVPDFRATERTFQLITQVAGRAGRGDRPGRVLIQTYQPDHFAIAAALRHDLPGFVASELRARQLANMPPFCHLALLEARHADPNLARHTLQKAVDALRSWGGEVRGPVNASVAKVRDIWRVHALVRAVERKPLHMALARLRAEILPQLPAAVDVTIDVDPASFS